MKNKCSSLSEIPRYLIDKELSLELRSRETEITKEEFKDLIKKGLIMVIG